MTARTMCDIQKKIIKYIKEHPPGPGPAPEIDYSKVIVVDPITLKSSNTQVLKGQLNMPGLMDLNRRALINGERLEYQDTSTGNYAVFDIYGAQAFKYQAQPELLIRSTFEPDKIEVAKIDKETEEEINKININDNAISGTIKNDFGGFDQLLIDLGDQNIHLKKQIAENKIKCVDINKNEIESQIIENNEVSKSGNFSCEGLELEYINTNNKQDSVFIDTNNIKISEKDPVSNAEVVKILIDKSGLITGQISNIVTMNTGKIITDGDQFGINDTDPEILVKNTNQRKAGLLVEGNYPAVGSFDSHSQYSYFKGEMFTFNPDDYNMVAQDAQIVPWGYIKDHTEGVDYTPYQRQPEVYPFFPSYTQSSTDPWITEPFTMGYEYVPGGTPVTTFTDDGVAWEEYNKGILVTGVNSHNYTNLTSILPPQIGDLGDPSGPPLAGGTGDIWLGCHYAQVKKMPSSTVENPTYHLNGAAALGMRVMRGYTRLMFMGTGWSDYASHTAWRYGGSSVLYTHSAAHSMFGDFEDRVPEKMANALAEEKYDKPKGLVTIRELVKEKDGYMLKYTLAIKMGDTTEPLKEYYTALSPEICEKLNKL